jgi:hypothetical protein
MNFLNKLVMLLEDNILPFIAGFILGMFVVVMRIS